MIQNDKNELLTEGEQAAMDLADAMTRTPAQVTDELFQRLQQHYNDSVIVEIGAVIALENYRARFNRCFGVEAIGSYDRYRELLAAVATLSARMSGRQRPR